MMPDERAEAEAHLRNLEHHFANELALMRKCNVGFLDWASRYRELRIGHSYRPFSLDGHEYLRQLYEEPWPVTIFEKAAQMGASELAVSFALWFVDTRQATAMYFFPTDKRVLDFSTTRVRPIIQRCEHLLEQIDDVNNAHLVKIGESFLYFRGMVSKDQVKSTPADLVIFDELDESNPANKAQAIERMSHSPWRWRMELSTPTIPNRGVDIEWQKSDQRYWHLACGCRDGVVLEDTFPDCVGVRGEGTEDADYFLRCPKCGKENLHPCEPAVVGEYRGWIPKLPEQRDVRGNHLCQLFGSGVANAGMGISLRAIWTEFKHTRDIPEFYNSKMGMPYAGDRMPLTPDVLSECHGDWDLIRAAKGVAIGVDQGDENHIVVSKRNPNTGQRHIIFACVTEQTDPWPETIEICRLFREPVIVTDAMPNKHDARKLCDAFPGSAFMCYYSDAQKDLVAQDLESDDPDSGRKVTVHRTESLDRLVDGFARTASGRSDGIVLPNAQVPVVQVVVDHLCALARLKRPRTMTVDGVKHETGDSEWFYTHTRPDHFAHAINYSEIAHGLQVHTAFAEFW